MKTYINLTPHPIKLNDGRVFEPSGTVARISTYFSAIVEDVCTVIYGELQGVPAAAENTLYIVSAMVLAATDRKDLVAPATGHPNTIRNEKGHIVSVPGFVE